MDEKEFISIVPNLRQVALNAAGGTGADVAEAEDIAQEVVIRLWQMRQRLENISSINGYTAAIARNMTISGFRRSQREAARKAFFTLEEGSASPEDALVMHDDEKLLEAELEKLPSTEYEVLRLRQVELRSGKEIADILGITEASVRTLLSRARRRLLEEIKKKR
ncbi:MAG: sigma-70 family RNA polymerase sigma factor [Bacteroidales bacterium]|nr:sigma-70 family RNA polymerase sigma factor [Bacteroidales bacterium]MDY6002273.1 sigma-70 family RNA polymerase sigma factor [Candidatus Cryptobacteroides sp.]